LAQNQGGNNGGVRQPDGARDVTEFDQRAATYDDGWRGAWHGEIVTRVGGIARKVAPGAETILDVGCGTGRLLADLAAMRPDATLIGVDPAPAMVEAARQRAAGRFEVKQAAAEALPLPDSSVDLALSVLSFDHWADQEAGLKEVRRVLRPGGVVVVADLFGTWLLLTTIVGRARRRIRGPRVMEAVCITTGMAPRAWQELQRVGPLPVVQALVADYSVPMTRKRK